MQVCVSDGVDICIQVFLMALTYVSRKDIEECETVMLRKSGAEERRTKWMNRNDAEITVRCRFQDGSILSVGSSVCLLHPFPLSLDFFGLSLCLSLSDSLSLPPTLFLFISFLSSVFSLLLRLTLSLIPHVSRIHVHTHTRVSVLRMAQDGAAECQRVT